MGPVVAMAETLKTNLPQMLEDHEEILVGLQALEEVALQAGRPDVTQLAERLKGHAELEAEVLYPAAIVAGEFLGSQLVGRRRSGS